MRLEHDAVAAGERRRRVAAGDREREREVARSEHRDRSDGHEHAADVGGGAERRLPGMVDRRLEVAAVAECLGEQPELEGAAAHLALETAGAEPGLAVGDGDEVGAVRVERVGDRIEQPGAPESIVGGRCLERRLRGPHHGVGPLGRGRLEVGDGRRAGARVGTGQHGFSEGQRSSPRAVSDR